MIKYENTKQNSKFDEYYQMDINVVTAELQRDTTTKLSPNVMEQISAEDWLRKHGLDKHKLKWENILDKIGFKRSEDYVDFLRKPVCSRYSGDIFVEEFCQESGKTYNITKNDKIIKLREKLDHLRNLYLERLNWLNCGTRRIFGLIVERSVTVVFDTTSSDKFGPYLAVALELVRTQISNIDKFNLVWTKEAPILFSNKLRQVTKESISEAMEWLREMSPRSGGTERCTFESVKAAIIDKTIEAVYLFSEGDSSLGSKDLIIDNIPQVVINVVVFDSVDYKLMNELKEITRSKNGRFHVYGINLQFDMFQMEDQKIQKIRKAFGGMPLGSGIREDVFKTFSELEQVEVFIERLKSIETKLSIKRQKIPGKESNPKTTRSFPIHSSEDWLSKNGLCARKLNIFDILANVAFKHCNGLVSLSNGDKIVDAKYCEQFGHVVWKDGRIMHVYVTNDVWREYCDKLRQILQKINHRLLWLRETSIYYFGRVMEHKAYILIDISQSMKTAMQYVHNILRALLNEQFVDCKYFNIVAFNQRYYCFQRKLTLATHFIINEALTWLTSIPLGTSTHFIPPLSHAINDLNTESIFIFSDGRPNEHVDDIYSTMRLNIPVNTLSFNPLDCQANEFLRSLSTKSEGTYSVHSCGINNNRPNSFKSEDTRMIEYEKHKCKEYIKVITKLRDQCRDKHKNVRTVISLRKFTGVANNDKAVPPSILNTINVPHIKEKPNESPMGETFKREANKPSECEEIHKWLRNNSLKSKNLILSDLLPESERTVSWSEVLKSGKTPQPKIKLYESLLHNFINKYEEFLNDCLTRVLGRDISIWFKGIDCVYAESQRHKLIGLINSVSTSMREAFLAVLDEYDLACYYKSRLMTYS